jgi:hypothetical protein
MDCCIILIRKYKPEKINFCSNVVIFSNAKWIRKWDAQSIIKCYFRFLMRKTVLSYCFAHKNIILTCFVSKTADHQNYFLLPKFCEYRFGKRNVKKFVSIYLLHYFHVKTNVFNVFSVIIMKILVSAWKSHSQ